MVRTHLALGSNLGDRISLLAQAIDRIGRLPETQVVAGSSVWDTEPAYHDDQPAFANMVVVVETGLEPDELFTHLTMIESDLGRERQFPNSPRTLDIDVLLYGGRVVETELLTVPHPRLLERDFVVTPLLEVDPSATLPDGTAVTREYVQVGRCIGAIAGADELGVTCYTSNPS